MTGDSEDPLPPARFGAGTSWFDLVIAGYEFPDTTEDCAHWLMIAGTVSIDGREWSFRDPCLETDEVERLANWLVAVAGGDSSKPSCWFTEPNLDFQLKAGGLVRINFSMECRPPWGKHLEWPECGFDIPVDETLLEVAASLRRQLAKFPTRDAGGS